MGRRLAAALIALAALSAVSGCSPGADYPSLFPAVHDMPPPRSDTTMDPLQVQQATEDLISDRNHLNAGTQGPQQGTQQQGTQKNSGDSGSTGNIRPATYKPGPVPGNGQSATTAPAETVGAETK
jgi:hypothetical protein